VRCEIGARQYESRRRTALSNGDISVELREWHEGGMNRPWGKGVIFVSDSPPSSAAYLPTAVDMSEQTMMYRLQIRWNHLSVWAVALLQTGRSELQR
jgi:hypothetical protein